MAEILGNTKSAIGPVDLAANAIRGLYRDGRYGSYTGEVLQICAALRLNRPQGSEVRKLIRADYMAAEIGSDDSEWLHEALTAIEQYTYCPTRYIGV